MKHTIRKFFFSWDFDKEEKWLNEMSSNGLQLTSVGFCKFVFNEGAPGEYVYRLELLQNLPSNEQSRQYIRFIEDTGAEYVDSFFRWAFFRKRADMNGFDLFSDIDSRIKHLNRLLFLLLVTGINVFLIGIMNVSVFWNGRLGNNLNIGIVDIILGLLLFYGSSKIFFKKRRMHKERILHE